MDIISARNRHTAPRFEQAFSYERMSAVNDVTDSVDGFYAYPGMSETRAFTYLQRADCRINHGDKGWKLHISIDSTQIDEAWFVITQTIRAHGVAVSKVIRREAIQALEESPQKGKVMTVYCFRQPEKSPEEWMNFIHDATRQLRIHNIRPGPQPGGEPRPITSGEVEEPEYGARIVESNYEDSSDEESDNDLNEHRIPETEYFSYRTDLYKDPSPNPLKRDGQFAGVSSSIVEYRHSP